MTDAQPATADAPWACTPTFAPTPAADVAVVDLDGELVLSHRHAPRALRFDPVTSLLWRSFDGVATVGELAEDVSDALGLAPDAALASMRSMVDGLAATGFLAPPAVAAVLRIPRFPTIPPDS